MNKKERPKITIYIAASIDGYIARTDGSLDWLDRVNSPGEDYGFQGFFDSFDALILGRKTYETVMSVNEWPYKNKRVIVLSRTLGSVHRDASLFKGDIHELVSMLHAEGIRHIWVDGGVTMSQFLSSMLVDQLILSVIPIILGSGTPLFNAVKQELPCRLLSTKSYQSGLVQLQYAVDQTG